MSNSILIKNVSRDFVKRWETGVFELTPVESLMRFVLTHDIEFVPDEASLNYTAILRPKQ